jgi:hypothetical protein
VNNPDFLEQLHELQHKLQFIKTQQFKDAKSVGDVHDVVENLKYKVSKFAKIIHLIYSIGNGKNSRMVIAENFHISEAVNQLSNYTKCIAKK